MLQEVGPEHSLLDFQSAVAALSDLEGEPARSVDALIVNVVLPFLEVRDAVRRLRGLPALAEARCAVTVLDDDDRIHVPAECSYLIKPVSAEALRAFLLAD